MALAIRKIMEEKREAGEMTKGPAPSTNQIGPNFLTRWK